MQFKLSKGLIRKSIYHSTIIGRLNLGTDVIQGYHGGLDLLLHPYNVR